MDDCRSDVCGRLESPSAAEKGTKASRFTFKNVIKFIARDFRICEGCGRLVIRRTPFTCRCQKDVETTNIFSRCQRLPSENVGTKGKETLCATESENIFSKKQTECLPLQLYSGNVQQPGQASAGPSCYQPQVTDTIKSYQSQPGPLSYPGVNIYGLMGLPLTHPETTGPLLIEEQELDPEVAELLGNEKERVKALHLSQRFYVRLVQWIGLKKKTKQVPRTVERHAKAHYGLRPEGPQPDQRNARKRFSEMLKKASKGSQDEHRNLLVQQESGYSSPNISAQHTPTAHNRFVTHTGFIRRSLELSPRRPLQHFYPRMSLPCDNDHHPLDGRLSAQAAERRRRLSRGKTICPDDSFPAPLTNQKPSISNVNNATNLPVTSRRRRMSRPGSSSREESTGEESGYEEDESVEIRVPPRVVEERVIEERRDSSSSGFQLKESTDPMSEWLIPWSQLCFGQLIRKGLDTNIFRGRWHGDVMIHTYAGNDSAVESRFWSHVSNLSLIRHENIVLFMGACMTPPNLAIVTSVRRGLSLYHHITTKGSIPYPSRVNIARQVAQAMSYLHSRGIIHGWLNSRNVFLDCKIKLSLLDHSLAEDIPAGDQFGCLPQRLLTYIPPEMVRNIIVRHPRVEVPDCPTEQSDIFNFGTLLYELFADKPPFTGHDPHVIIYQVGCGHVQSTQELQCAQNLKTLIDECWDPMPDQRPVFAVILKMLQQILTLHRTHSTSEPERLNRVGASGKHC